MSDKKPWAQEPTPICDKNARDGCYWTDQGSRIELLPGDYKRAANGEVVLFDVAQDLERRLRHALKLVNSLRIDVMHDDEANYILDERLSAIEEVLQ